VPARPRVAAAVRGSRGRCPPPVVPAEGQFVWTVDSLTVTANDTFMVNSLKAVGYRFSGILLAIDAPTEQLLFCTHRFSPGTFASYSCGVDGT